VDATGRQENLYALTGLDRILPLSEAPVEAMAGVGSDFFPGAPA
jgi:hypothetical protein